MNWDSEWLGYTHFYISNEKWLHLLITCIAAILIKWISYQLFSFLKGRDYFRKHSPRLVDLWLELPIHRTLSWLLATLFWLGAVKTLGLPEKLVSACTLVGKVVLAITIIRLCYLSVNAIGAWITEKAQTTGSRLDYQIVPFVVKTLKVVVVIFGILVTMQNFGIHVVSILAGLGLGGLALALAAQDTAANLFGSITILIDRPFKVGDSVKIGSTEGTVEEVGFRSTRLKTPYNSMITIPNSVVAKESIDNLGVRRVRRLRHTFGFTYSASPEKLKLFQDKFKTYLQQHSLIRKEDILLHVNQLGDFSLQMLMNVHLNVKTLKDELQVQEDVLFTALQIAKESGLEFAYPTQTLFVEKSNS